jgi:hypothetical protein
MRRFNLVLAAAISQAMPLSATAINTNMSDPSQPGARTDTYFRENVASNILYAHIAFMLLSWVDVLPICSLRPVLPSIITKANNVYGGSFDVEYLGL